MMEGKMRSDSILSKVFFNGLKNGFFYGLILFIGVAVTNRSFAQSVEITPEMIQKGQEALDQGLITPEQARELQHKAATGTLTPAEIEAGQKLLEQQKSNETEAPTTETKPIEQPKKPVLVDSAIDDESTGPEESDQSQKDERIKIEPDEETPENETTKADKAEKREADEAEEIEAEPESEKDREAAQEASAAHFEEEYFKKSEASDYPVLPIFGHDLFSSAPSTFAPIKDIPVSNDYIIGPDDELKVQTWGLLEADYSLIVTKEGIINLPKIGRLSVGGLTFGEVKKLIKSKVEAMTGVKAGVSMGALRSIHVLVLGEVSAPGLYTISALASAANALLTSGGPTKLGSLRNVQVKRHGKVIARLDLYDFLLKGDTSSNSRLMPGDVIFVPQAGPQVMVSGNVKRPAVYEMKNEKTLETALNLSGGLAPRAFNQRIQIERFQDNKARIVLDISQAELAQKKRIPLRDGDLIRVFSILPGTQNAVFLFGNVTRPGRYAYTAGLRIKDILPDVGSLAIDTYFDYALIKRYRTVDMKAELLPFDLGALLKKNDQRQNLTLKPLDEVYIFDKSIFQDKEFAEVTGEVRRPGRYHLQDMKVRDLILKAGDLTHKAYLHKAEIIRIDTERNRHTLYFDVAAAMRNDPKHNLALQNEDRLIIHSIWEDQWKKSVTIQGEIKVPGEYDLTAGMRLSDLIFKAGGFTRQAYPDMGHLYRTDWRTKKKTLFTFNLSNAIKGDQTQNMLLEDLDEVVVHNIDEYMADYTVAVQGLVNNPGEYPYAANMTIKDLLLIAGNVKDAAFMDEAELVRFTIVDGRKVKTTVRKFDVGRALADDPTYNLKLMPQDVVTIKEIPEWWDKKKSVTVSGEVFFPGTYQIRTEEHLSDILKRAGGYTEYAYLYGAMFTRESVKAVQKERLDELARRLEKEVAQMMSVEVQTALSPQDMAAQSQMISTQKVLLENLKSAEPTGRVVVDLKPVAELAQTTSDLVLEDGDTIFIPKKPSTVSVLGAVYNPTALSFDQKQNKLRYYLAMTGGPTENAQEDAMYVVQANGTVISSKKTAWWSDFENTRLNPGDTVLVPERIIRPSYMRDFKDITQILYQIATTAGVTVALF
jgi:polysaccharide export outer membrane protein